MVDNVPAVDTHMCLYTVHRTLDSHLSVCQQSSYCGTFSSESDVLSTFLKNKFSLRKHVLVFLKNKLFNPKCKANSNYKIIVNKFTKLMKYYILVFYKK